MGVTNTLIESYKLNFIERYMNTARRLQIHLIKFTDTENKFRRSLLKGTYTQNKAYKHIDRKLQTQCQKDINKYIKFHIYTLLESFKLIAKVTFKLIKLYANYI